MREHQLCVSEGGTHPGEGHFRVNLRTRFFFFQTAERLFSETAGLFSFPKD